MTRTPSRSHVGHVPRGVAWRGVLALALVGAIAASPVAPRPASAQGLAADAELVARAREIHRRVLTLDTHVDINPSHFTAQHPNYTDRLPTQVNLPKMKAGGLDAVFFSIYVGQGEQTPEGYARATAEDMEKFAAVHRLAEQIAPEQIAIAYTAADVTRIHAAGKLVALMGARATVRDFVDHIDYAVKLVGLEHVGISLDFDGGGGVEGFSDATESPNVTIERVRRGYTEAQIGQLWSGNLLRVMAENEKVAARLQAEGEAR